MKGKSGSTKARACSVLVNCAKPKPLETPVVRAWSGRGAEKEHVNALLHAKEVRRGKCL